VAGAAVDGDVVLARRWASGRHGRRVTGEVRSEKGEVRGKT
jgi:hypothetical protein